MQHDAPMEAERVSGLLEPSAGKLLQRAEQNGMHPRLRVALYSHDTMGVGHMRRNLLIAQYLSLQVKVASALVIAGAKEASVFAERAGVDCLTMPSYQKSAQGDYSPRHLELSTGQLVKMRSDILLSIARTYQPDVLIVDKVPGGVHGELTPALDWLSRDTQCRCILGLREILDSPKTVKQEWKVNGTIELIRKYYESVWIYGDRRVFDPVCEYQYPVDVAARTRFAGYLNVQFRKAIPHPFELTRHRDYFLCTVGGGQDGEGLARQFVQAMKLLKQPAVLLCGPYMPDLARGQLHELARNDDWLEVLDFVDEGDELIKRSRAVVCMGGYNTLCSILAYGKPAIVVPRESPRYEQHIRAARLEQLGLVSMIRPGDLTVERLVGTMQSIFTNRGAKNALHRPEIDLGGLERIGNWLIGDRQNGRPVGNPKLTIETS